MEILKLKLNNFKCFESLEMDFQNIEGIYQIKGKIGSGKTTISEGILYSLYGTVNGKKLKDLIKWGTKHGSVEVELVAKNRRVNIKRELNAYGQSPMEVLINDEPLICSDKREIQSVLEEEYLDVPRQIMEMLCIISFNNFTSLSQMNTKATNYFLDNVLNFNILTEYVDKAKETISAKNALINDLKAKLSYIEREISSHIPPEETNDDIKQIDEQITDVQSRLKLNDKEYEDACRGILQDHADASNESRNCISKGQELRKQINFIEAGVCPTCGGPIDQTPLAGLKDQINELLKQHAELKKKIEGYDDDLRRFKWEHDNKERNLQSELPPLRSKRDKILQSQAYKEFVEQKRTKLFEDKNAYESQRVDHEVESNKFIELRDVLQNEIKSQIIGSIVPIINQQCAILSAAVDMDFRPMFTSDFDCVIMRDAEEVSRASLSTGQGKIIDTIIIIAVLLSIAQHVQSNVIFLDELMSNLDDQTRSQLLYVIKSRIKDKVIFIVSHQDLEKEFINGVVKITRDENNNATLIY